MQLKFTSDAYYNGTLVFLKDQVYDVSEELGYAQRWLSRGLAVQVLFEEKKLEQTIDVVEKLEETIEEVQAIIEEEFPKKKRNFNKRV